MQAGTCTVKHTVHLRLAQVQLFRNRLEALAFYGVGVEDPQLSGFEGVDGVTEYLSEFQASVCEIPRILMRAALHERLILG